MKKYIPGMGNSGAKLMFIGEAPSYDDTTAGKPFQAAGGKELDKLCKDSGINRAESWVSNVFKYEIPSNPKGKKIPAWIRAKNAGIDVDESLAELQNEINAIKPNCIMGLGGTALWALTGKTKISNYRGSIMRGMSRKCVFTYHPTHLLHTEGEIKGYWNRYIMIFDFKRALAQSKFEEMVLPRRTLQVCNNSSDLHSFLERYKNDIRLSVDIEAGGSCIPICIGLAFNKHHGMCVPLWNRDNISNIPDSDLTQIWIKLAEILYEKEIIGQNFNYDRDKLRRLGFIIRKLYSDTMLKAQAINPELPKRLSFNTSIYTEEPFYKDEGMYEGKIEDLFLGCARDACVTYEVDENMDADLDEIGQRDYYENFLLQLPELYGEMERTGFGVDIEKRDKLIHKYVAWDEKLRYELFKLTNQIVNCNSPKQIYSLLFDTLKCPVRKGTGEEELTGLLNLQSFTDENKRRVVEIVLEDRRVRKTLSTYLMALPDFDGRMRTTFFPCLETGRSSTGQQDPPIRPVMDVKTGKFTGKKKKGQNYRALGMAFQTITKHGDIGEDVREMFIP